MNTKYPYLSPALVRIVRFAYLRGEDSEGFIEQKKEER
jgi:hypothetical protein